MNDIELKNGILCGLLSTGLGIGSSQSEEASGDEGMETDHLPDAGKLKILNAAYNKKGTILKANTYISVLSSGQGGVPSQGYLMIGGFDMIDMEGMVDFPEGYIRITVDGVTVVDSEIFECFEDVSIDPPKAFQYKSSFDVSVMIIDKGGEIHLWLTETMVVGI